MGTFPLPPKALGGHSIFFPCIKLFIHNSEVTAISNEIDDPNMKNLIRSKISQKLPNLCYFYGMPKIHKEGVPLRPIVATCGSPTAIMAKWLANTLSSFLGKFSSSHLYHTQDFITRIKNLGYTPRRLVSFDVTALFTSIPLDDVLNFLEVKHSEGELPLPIPVKLFIRLIRLCVKSSIFLFDDKVYQQAYGVSMGSPLSPILANLYICTWSTLSLPYSLTSLIIYSLQFGFVM